MSILTSTNTGLSKNIEDWCSFHFGEDRNVQYRIEKGKEEWHIVLTPSIQNGLIILRGEDLPCKVYFEGRPNVFFTFFDDHSIKHISYCFHRFCENYKFLNCTFSEISIDFIKKHFTKMSDTNLLFFSKDVYKKFMNDMNSEDCKFNYQLYAVSNKIEVYLLPKNYENNPSDAVLQVISPATMWNQVYDRAKDIDNHKDDARYSLRQMIAYGIYTKTIDLSTQNFQ